MQPTETSSVDTPIVVDASDGGDQEHIKTMQLYTDVVERIDNELRARGIDNHETYIDPHVLSEIDSMHYEGDDAIMAAISALNLSASSSVLDVGSGFGGPARVLAAQVRCDVVAMELQGDIHDKASQLTRRCKLSALVHHHHGDIIQCDTSAIGRGTRSFDAVVSWLVFLHISNKEALFGKCRELLKEEGGKLFFDDFFMLHAFTKDQELSLKNDVYCADLPTREEYIKCLENCGFHHIKFQDRTVEWKKYVNDRVKQFVGAQERFEQVQGKPMYDHLLHFYMAIVELFNSGNLGGVRIVAEKKP